MPLKTLFLNPPSFENFDGGAGSRWPATREIESYWYPVWLAYPAGMLEGARLLDAPPHNYTIQQTVDEDPDFVTLVFELFTLSRRNAEIADEYAGLMRRTRERVAGMLAVAQEGGILHLHAEPEAVAEILFSLGDGLALRMLSEPDRNFTPTIRAGITSVRALLTD